MKKLIALLLAVIMVSSMLMACGNKEDSKTDDTSAPSESTTEPTTEPSTEPTTEPVVEAATYPGYYIIESATDSSGTYTGSDLEDIGLADCFIILNEDGTGFLVGDGEWLDATWTETEITANGGNSIPCTLDGDVLTLSDGEETIVLVRSSDPAPEKPTTPATEIEVAAGDEEEIGRLACDYIVDSFNDFISGNFLAGDEESCIGFKGLMDSYLDWIIEYADMTEEELLGSMGVDSRDGFFELFASLFASAFGGEELGTVSGEVLDVELLSDWDDQLEDTLAAVDALLESMSADLTAEDLFDTGRITGAAVVDLSLSMEGEAYSEELEVVMVRVDGEWMPLVSLLLIFVGMGI